jgi:hypothetical protein
MLPDQYFSGPAILLSGVVAGICAGHTAFEHSDLAKMV